MSAHQPAHRLVVEHCHLRLEKRGLHPGPLSRHLPVQQRGQDALGQKETGAKVRDRDADAERPSARLAGHGHQPAQALRDLVHPAPVGIGPGLAEARDGAVDDPRVDRANGLVIDAEAMLHVGPHVLDDDVRVPGQTQEEVAPLGCFQVDPDRTLAPVQILEIAAVAGPDQIAGRLVRLAPLDPEHIGAPVRQLAHGERTRPRMGEVEHPEPRERAPGPRHRVRMAFGWPVIVRHVILLPPASDRPRISVAGMIRPNKQQDLTIIAAFLNSRKPPRRGSR